MHSKPTLVRSDLGSKLDSSAQGRCSVLPGLVNWCSWSRRSSLATVKALVACSRSSLHRQQSPVVAEACRPSSSWPECDMQRKTKEEFGHRAIRIADHYRSRLKKKNRAARSNLTPLLEEIWRANDILSLRPLARRLFVYSSPGMKCVQRT